MICLKRKEEKREEKKRTRQDGKNGSSTNTTSKKYFVLLLLDEETVSFSVIVGENAVLVEFSFKRYIFTQMEQLKKTPVTNRNSVWFIGGMETFFFSLSYSLFNSLVSFQVTRIEHLQKQQKQQKLLKSAGKREFGIKISLGQQTNRQYSICCDFTWKEQRKNGTNLMNCLFSRCIFVVAFTKLSVIGFFYHLLT